MCDGGFRQMRLRPLGLSRPSPVRGRQQGFGSWPRFIVIVRACRVTVLRAAQVATGSRALVAERAEEVVAAFQELARDRDARAVAADPRGELFVVGAVRAAGTTRGLRGFVERPAQRGWSLPTEMPRGAALVGFADRDVQTPVADRVAGVLKPAGVAELGEDRDRRQLADAVDLDRSACGSQSACGRRPAARDRTGRAAGRSRRSSAVRS